ncbi:MAG: hypothetical protein NDP13_04920 [Crenarchaeota archaeon]|nr:hypothetical protein [Thermoproteota archaeon]MCR8454309.1 hypothetical protein [Thermoproteota archaeon]MCR8455077.1 hypothetical protein [Thermoproteota archaeon]MCR8470817.1 hypothetical protein [Thermoproteota archaeon]MCR8472125.1 hypothetical protein [Thermoproteota archaeon]
MELEVNDPRLIQITTFLGTLGVIPRDFFETEDRLSILLDEEYSDSLPKMKSALTYLRKIAHKDVDIILFSNDLNRFCSYLFHPAKVNKIELRKSKKGRILIVHVDFWQRGIALGKRSYKLHRARYFISKYFPRIENVYIQT